MVHKKNKIKWAPKYHQILLYNNLIVYKDIHPVHKIFIDIKLEEKKNLRTLSEN